MEGDHKYPADLQAPTTRMAKTGDQYELQLNPF